MSTQLLPGRHIPGGAARLQPHALLSSSGLASKTNPCHLPEKYMLSSTRAYTVGCAIIMIGMLCTLAAPLLYLFCGVSGFSFWFIGFLDFNKISKMCTCDYRKPMQPPTHKQARGVGAMHCKVYRICWWMKHYGSETAKRHQAFTNNKFAGAYNRGKLCAKDRVNKTTKTTRRYVDSRGRTRWNGTAKLKQTQSRPQLLFFVVCNIIMERPYTAKPGQIQRASKGVSQWIRSSNGTHDAAIDDTRPRKAVACCSKTRA